MMTPFWRERRRGSRVRAGLPAAFTFGGMQGRIIIKTRRACLTDHFPDGIGSSLLCNAGQRRALGSQGVVIVLEIREPDVHEAFEHADGLHSLKATAVINDGDMKLWLCRFKCLQDRRQEMGRGYKIDVVRALILKPKEDPGKLRYGDFLSKASCADLMILAEDAAERTVGKENSAGTGRCGAIRTRFRGSSGRGSCSRI